MSRVAGEAPKPQASSSDGDTTIELPGEIVTWSVLVWYGRQRGMKKGLCDGPVFFLGAREGSTLCLRPSDLVLRLLRWPCLGNGGSHL